MEKTREILDSILIESTAGRAEFKDGWPCVSFSVTLTRNGANILTTEYHMGTGHFPLPKSVNGHPYGLPRGLEAVYNTLEGHPGVKLKDESLRADLAAWIANRPKKEIRPGVEDVMSSLLMDGSAYFDHATFTEWAADFGYNEDSIRARKMYEVCIDAGRALARALTPAELSALREWASDY